MKISYREEIDHRYLVVEGCGSDHLFETQMLERNQIPRFLPLQRRLLDGEWQLCYRITARKSVTDLYEKRMLRSQDLRMLFCGLQEAVERAGSYLLPAEGILYDPQYLFAEDQKKELSVCCVPGRECEEEGQFREELKGLAEFVLRHLDHTDSEAVRAGYLFYQEVLEEHFGLGLALQKVCAVFQTPECQKMADDPFAYREPGERAFVAASAQQERAFPEAGGMEAEIEGIRGVGPEKSAAQEKTAQKYRAGSERGGKAKDQPGSKAAGKSGKQPGSRKAEGRLGRSAKTKAALAMLGVGLLVVNVVCHLFLELDLTQSGGLVFLSLALLWLGIRLTEPQEKQPVREWTMEEEDPDPLFLDGLFHDVYDSGVKRMPGKGDIPAEEAAREESDAGRAGRSWEENGAVRARRAGEESEAAGGWRTGEESGIFRGKTVYEEKDADRRDVFYDDQLTRCIMPEEEEAQLKLVSFDEGHFQSLIADSSHYVIGKQEGTADGVIRSDTVSRYHAAIDQEDDGYYLTDLNSRNGTFVNGERLAPFTKRQLHNADQIRFAQVVFAVRISQ